MNIKKKNLKILLHEDGMNELLEPLDIIHGGCLITVPIGFVCDGATVPRFFWRVCGPPRLHENLIPGIFHDYMYSTHMFNRKNCDILFYKALRCMGKTWVIAKMMYYAVRMFGGSRY